MPPSPPPPLHDLEALVMEQMWDRGEATVRTVLEALNSAGGRTRAYTTVMTIMSRLDGKGLLSRRREGKTDVYVAVLDREAYRQARAEAEVAELVDQYGEVALVHFARQMQQLDPDRRRRLRRLAQRG
jgi:predicted transcriptional regulator